jgi:hypothetical protein
MYGILFLISNILSQIMQYTLGQRSVTILTGSFKEICPRLTAYVQLCNILAFSH